MKWIFNILRILLRSDFEMVYDITNLNRTLTKSSTVQNDMKIHEIRTKYLEDK
jgi:hypothetical protein